MSKRAVVSFCNNRGNYIKGMERLSKSLDGNFDGDFVGFTYEESVGAPPHLENPYAFKIYCIEKAVEMGYDKILWVDASVLAIRNVNITFGEIEKDGMIFQEAGHMLGNWSSDKQLEYFGIKRDEAMSIRMIGNAGFLGFDFTNPIAIKFFQLWKQSMLDGCFKGAWNNNNKTESQDERCKGSRHDMSCSSAIVYKLGLDKLMKKGDEWLEYAPPESLPKNETIIWKAQGL